MNLTWQMQHGSKFCVVIAMNERCFLCFIDFIMTSSVNPVLTSPMLSPSANSS
ncbi:hypothetical protein Hanom_Chr00s000006g01613171 [Helianthus anomalus]